MATFRVISVRKLLVTYAYCNTEAEEISSREISVPRPKTQTPLKQQASA